MKRNRSQLLTSANSRTVSNEHQLCLEKLASSFRAKIPFINKEVERRFAFLSTDDLSAAIESDIAMSNLKISTHVPRSYRQPKRKSKQNSLKVRPAEPQCARESAPKDDSESPASEESSDESTAHRFQRLKKKRMRRSWESSLDRQQRSLHELDSQLERMRS